MAIDSITQSRTPRFYILYRTDRERIYFALRIQSWLLNYVYTSKSNRGKVFFERKYAYKTL